jgi:hypothetical protein
VIKWVETVTNEIPEIQVGYFGKQGEKALSKVGERKVERPKRSFDLMVDCT